MVQSLLDRNAYTTFNIQALEVVTNFTSCDMI
jgi:hypothetical protein